LPGRARGLAQCVLWRILQDELGLDQFGARVGTLRLLGGQQLLLFSDLLLGQRIGGVLVSPVFLAPGFQRVLLRDGRLAPSLVPLPSGDQREGRQQQHDCDRGPGAPALSCLRRFGAFPDELAFFVVEVVRVALQQPLLGSRQAQAGQQRVGLLL